MDENDFSDNNIIAYEIDGHIPRWTVTAESTFPLTLSTVIYYLFTWKITLPGGSRKTISSLAMA